MEKLQTKCRMCSGVINHERCVSCGALCPIRDIKDINVNADFTDYSYNRYDKSFIFKIYLQWLEFSAFLFSQKNRTARFFGFVLSPLLGGSPRIEFSEKERFIDIGCGRGLFLKYLPEKWDISGTDIVNYGNTNQSIIVGNFENFNEEKKFSIVRSSHSLEHAIRPTVFLDKIISITDTNGIIVISSPNADSLSRSLFGKFWVPFNVDSHFCILNIVTLKNYLEKHGCRVIYSGTYTLFSSAGSFVEMLGLKSFSGVLFVIFNIIFLPLTLVELLLGRGDSFIIYAKKI